MSVAYTAAVGTSEGSIIAAIITAHTPVNQPTVPNPAPGPASIPDIRAAVEDVSGVLAITQGKATTTERFSVMVQVGSARWHDGYGTVLVSDWKEA